MKASSPLPISVSGRSGATGAGCGVATTGVGAGASRLSSSVIAGGLSGPGGAAGDALVGAAISGPSTNLNWSSFVLGA